MAWNINRSKRWSHLFFGTSFIALLSGVLALLQASFHGSRPEVTIDNPRKDIGKNRVGNKIEIHFNLINHTSEHVSILGAQSLCTPEGCMRVDGLPFTVLPHGHKTLVVTFQPLRPGVISAEIELFTDGEHALRIPIALSGEIIENN